MNQPCSTRYFESLVAFSLALATLPALDAQPRCPGNTASVTPRFVQRALIVIPVVARRFRGRPERTTPREMQDNLRLAVVLPNHPRELRTVLNVNDVACLALQIYRNLPRKASVRQAGGRNWWSARRK